MVVGTGSGKRLRKAVERRIMPSLSQFEKDIIFHAYTSAAIDVYERQERKPLIDRIVYGLKLYRLLPWNYGGRYIFQLPTKIWVIRRWKEAAEILKNIAYSRGMSVEEYLQNEMKNSS